MLIMAAINGFFSGRGQTWTVLGIEAAGTAVNVVLAQVLIFGRLGFPELGIAGAGWATVAGSWASAMLAMALFLRPRYRREFQTLSGWRLERDLFGRLMKYGGPAGAQVFLDVLVFHVFVQLVGRLGEAQTAATTLTVRLNMVAFLPMMGLGQAVAILVGQRLGGRPAGPGRTLRLHRAQVGLRLHVHGRRGLPALSRRCWSACSRGTAIRPGSRNVAAIVPSLLVCVAIYSLADAVNVTFSFALRAPAIPGSSRC